MWRSPENYPENDASQKVSDLFQGFIFSDPCWFSGAYFQMYTHPIRINVWYIHQHLIGFYWQI